MKYLVIGAGGTGAPLAGFLNLGGMDVALIARGENLKAINENGLNIKQNIIAKDGTLIKETKRAFVPVFSEEEYEESPDVIFLCVKSYSVDSTLDLIKRVSKPSTVVIPLLNIFTTGEYISKKIPELFVTDGCIYIASALSAPGEIVMDGEIFRVVFGSRKAGDKKDILKEIESDLCKCNILGIYSDEIRKSALEKFSYVSPMAAAGLLFDAKAKEMQRPGKERETFIALIKEIEILAKSMGISLSGMVERNLKILSELSPNASTSMQRDVEKGKNSEIDGLIHFVARESKEKNLGLKNYEMISERFSDVK